MEPTNIESQINELPNVLYKIDLQKLISGEYVHTILKNRWLSRQIKSEQYIELLDIAGLTGAVYVDTITDDIYFRTQASAKRFIKYISKHIYHHATYAKVLIFNRSNGTKQIGESIRPIDYLLYGSVNS